MTALPIWRLSGGGANTSPAASLGGIMSTTTAAGLNLFDDIAADESAAGDIEYRGIYILNNGDANLTTAFVWIQVNTPDPDTTVSIALAFEGFNTTMATLANESTGPVGPVFTAPTSLANGIALGTLAPGQRYGIWIRRTVTAGAAAYNNDTFQLRVSGASS